MKKTYHNTFLFLGISIFITACASNSEPSWLTNPQFSIGDKRAAVGCSSIHVDGINAQEQLAIQRAIDSIAMQKNTKVSNVTLRKSSQSASGLNSSSVDSTSLHTVNNTNISTKILDKYNKPDGDICVWVVEE